MADITKLGFDFPDLVVYGAETTAPAAAAVLADTGAIAVAGHYRVRVKAATNDTAQNILQIAHRNAANAADVNLQDLSSGPNTWCEGEALFNLAANERVVVRPLAAGTAAKVYQVVIYAWLLP